MIKLNTIRKDLTGEKFNKLTVIGLSKERRGIRKVICWDCLCECGLTTTIRGNELKSGKIKSCGKCSYNTFKFEENLIIGIDKNNKEFYFDKEDYGKVKAHTWLVNSRGYVETIINSKRVLLHRFLTNPDTKEVVDHINHKTNDNRRCNLRLCNKYENAQHRVVAINNTSKVTGVSWNKNYQKWEVFINYNKNRVFLGRFTDMSRAIKVRLEAELKYFGEFRYKGNDTKIIEILREISLGK